MGLVFVQGVETATYLLEFFSQKIIPGMLGEGFLAGISNANESQVVGSSFAPANLNDSNKEKLCSKEGMTRQEGAKGRKIVVDRCRYLRSTVSDRHLHVYTIFT